MGFDDDRDDCRMPPEGWLRDPLGNHVAEVRHYDDTAVLHDRLGNGLGAYDPRQDRTFDPLGNIVGQGNWLGTLLGRRR